MRKYLWLILCLALLLSACAKKEAAPNAVVTEPTGPVQQELTTQQRLDATIDALKEAAEQQHK